MSLRFSLVLIIALSFASIGASLFIHGGFGSSKKADLPFFYTLSPDDLRTIDIRHGDSEISWSQRAGSTRWYFDGMRDMPADLNRWGGITTLVSGPQVARVLKDSFDDPSLYGLDNPATEITLTLRDGETRTLQLGDLTPDGQANYARMVGHPELVLVDYTWGQVLNRLVDEPPYPEWYFTLVPDQASEILFYKENDVTMGYGKDSATGDWHLCDMPLADDPCSGTTPADNDAIMNALKLIAQRQIQGAVKLNIPDQAGFEPYGVDVNAPYIAIRVDTKEASGVTSVNRVTMSIGDVTDDGQSRYMVANETSDVIRANKAWADQLLGLFDDGPVFTPGS